MTDLTVAEFRARFPQFDETTYPDTQVQALIDDTLCSFDQGRWDCLYKRGHSLYIAHLVEIGSRQSAGDSGTGGLDALQSKSADGLSAGFSTVAPANFDDAFFAGTSYGREFLMMRRSVGIGAVCC